MINNNILLIKNIEIHHIFYWLFEWKYSIKIHYNYLFNYIVMEYLTSKLIKEVIISKRSTQAGLNWKSFILLLIIKILYSISSETIYEDSELHINYIIKHLPLHLNSLSDEEFGHYLAGLTDGDGNFSIRSYSIIFSLQDVSLAYYIKFRLGYGKVKKIKSKKAVIFAIYNKEGLETIINLLNGKLRVIFKLECIIKNITNIYVTPLNILHPLTLNTSNNLNNYWLAGFTDADGSFQIKLLNRKRLGRKKTWEVRFNFQVDQKTDSLLRLIHSLFGGYIGHRKINNTYYYGSTSYTSAKLIIKYFDEYKLMSSKYNSFLKWKEAYKLTIAKKHKTEKGILRIKSLKSSMNKQITIDE